MSSEQTTAPVFVEATKVVPDAPTTHGGDQAGFLLTAHGLFETRLNVGLGVNRFTSVMISLCEVTTDPNGALTVPFLGLANMYVYNVAPHDDGTVEVRGHVFWERDLNIWVNVLVGHN
jgi:hypothetical protein